MLIRLTYALSEGKAIVVTDTWPSTWEALNWANRMGALVAAAKVVS